jgi:hypothetical protein
VSLYLGNPHNQAVLDLLRTAWPLVGDCETPAGLTYDSNHALIVAYLIVYPLGSPTFDGSLAPGDEQSIAWPSTQVTAVGRDRNQAGWLRDKARAVLLGSYLTAAGRRVGPMRLRDEQPVERDDDVTPHLFYAVDRYRAVSTTA